MMLPCCCRIITVSSWHLVVLSHPSPSLPFSLLIPLFSPPSSLFLSLYLLFLVIRVESRLSPILRCKTFWWERPSQSRLVWIFSTSSMATDSCVKLDVCEHARICVYVCACECISGKRQCKRLWCHGVWYWKWCLCVRVCVCEREWQRDRQEKRERRTQNDIFVHL